MGEWKTATLNGAGKYSLNVKMTNKGTWYFRTRMASDSGHTTTFSRISSSGSTERVDLTRTSSPPQSKGGPPPGGPPFSRVRAGRAHGSGDGGESTPGRRLSAACYATGRPAQRSGRGARCTGRMPRFPGGRVKLEDLLGRHVRYKGEEGHVVEGHSGEGRSGDESSVVVSIRGAHQVPRRNVIVPESEWGELELLP